MKLETNTNTNNEYYNRRCLWCKKDFLTKVSDEKVCIRCWTSRYTNSSWNYFSRTWTTEVRKHCQNSGFFGSIGLSPELALLIGLLEVIGGIFLVVGVAVAKQVYLRFALLFTIENIIRRI